MINIVMMGPPGSGKGTQSTLIAQKHGLAHISTGEIFREEISAKTELGILADQLINKGHLIPDEFLLDVLRAGISRKANKVGYIFDGFPRTLPQAEAFDGFMQEMSLSNTLFFALMINEDETMKRLLKRAEIEGREDDTKEVILERIKVYHKQTAPIIPFYAERKNFLRLDAQGEIDRIFADLSNYIEKTIQ